MISCLLEKKFTAWVDDKRQIFRGPFPWRKTPSVAHCQGSASWRWSSRPWGADRPSGRSKRLLLSSSVSLVASDRHWHSRSLGRECHWTKSASSVAFGFGASPIWSCCLLQRRALGAQHSPDTIASCAIFHHIYVHITAIPYIESIINKSSQLIVIITCRYIELVFRAMRRIFCCGRKACHCCAVFPEARRWNLAWLDSHRIGHEWRVASFRWFFSQWAGSSDTLSPVFRCLGSPGMARSVV